MNKLKEQKGASLIEFVIVLIPLLILLFASIEFGVIGYNKAMITNASREGARAGVLYDSSLPNNRVPFSEIERVVRDYCAGHVISFGSGSGLTLSPPLYETKLSGEYLTVTVNYNHGFLILQNLIPIFNQTIDLQAVSVMRMEG